MLRCVIVRLGEAICCILRDVRKFCYVCQQFFLNILTEALTEKCDIFDEMPIGNTIASVDGQNVHFVCGFLKRQSKSSKCGFFSYIRRYVLQV